MRWRPIFERIVRYFRSATLDVATLFLTPLECVLVSGLWLLFVAIVAYGDAHDWARRWIMAAYEMMIGSGGDE